MTKYSETNQQFITLFLHACCSGSSLLLFLKPFVFVTAMNTFENSVILFDLMMKFKTRHG